MDLLQQLQRELGARSDERFLDAALTAVRSSARSDELRQVASWALAGAMQRDQETSYGLLQMLAGAAMARARLLAAPVATAVDESALLAALTGLQDRLDAGLERTRALDEFALLGAQLLASALPRYFDMRLRSDPDDTVFYWASGVLALKQGASAAGDPAHLL